MMKKFKSFGADVLQFSFFRTLFETLPTVLFFGVIWLAFHKTGIEVGSSDNPETTIHMTVELLVAILFHIFAEITMGEKGYLRASKEDKVGRMANYTSMLLHGLVIMFIVLAFLFKCKTWLDY